MPFGDGTGPMGMGPMTGRGFGYCAGYPAPGFANPMPSSGWGRGSYPYGGMYPQTGYYGTAPYPTPMPYMPWFGRGFGFGRGWGRGRGRWFRGW